MPFEYLDDVAMADVAFRAWGETFEELIVAAGDAVMAVMIGALESIEPRETRVLAVDNPDADMLLFNVLQELVFFKDAQNLLLRIQSPRVTRAGDGYRFLGAGVGEPIDRGRHRMSVDVKAVTLHLFRVAHTDSGWEAIVVLDI